MEISHNWWDHELKKLQPEVVKYTYNPVKTIHPI